MKKFTLVDHRIINEALDQHSIVSIADASGNITYANDKFCQISRYSRDELIGQSHRLLKSGLHDAKFFDEMWLTISSGHSWHGEVCNRSKDGSLYWVETTIVPSLDENGLPYQYVSMRTETTRLKSIEANLAQSKAELEIRVKERTCELQQEAAVRRESEQRFRQLAENISEVFWMTDLAKGQMLYVSPTYEQIWGKTVQSLYDSPHDWLDSIHSDDRPRVRQAALTKQATGIYDEEYRIIRPDGEVRWVHDKAFPVSNSDGVVYRIVGVAKDITERKQAEKELAKSEQHFRAVMQSASDGIVTGTEAGLIEGWNAAAGRLFGYTEAEVVGQSITVLIPERFRSFHNMGLTRVAAGGEKRIIGKTVEVVGLHKNGSEIQLELSLAQWGTADGQHFNAIIRDISERKSAEEQLRIAAVAFETHEAILITDAKANIIRTNRAFTEITGYRPNEVLGKNPRILSSGRHDKVFYAAMWQQLLTTGSWTGEVWDKRKSGEIYPKWLTITAVKNNAGEAVEYVGIFSDITVRKKAEDEIHKLAFYDSLTGLPNRRLLNDRLQQIMASSGRTGRQGALLFLDLDNFKTLNDTLGHDIGDLLLQQVAKRLTICIREGDTVARLGGDEFVIVLENLSEHTLEAAMQAEIVGKKILAAIGNPYRLATYEYMCTPSIGMTLFSAHAEKRIDELLKYADIAMYQAKKAGRNTLCFFDPQMQHSINARVAIEDDLRKALELRQFKLHYQIQVDSLHRPFGAEALIRWMHPQRGLVPPGQFIQLAEETGLIMPIGQWVLETACAQIKAWQQHALTRDLMLSVNISATQFHRADFVAQVQVAIARYAIKPALLKLELTESLLLEGIEDTIATMNALNEIGVLISLDDFGTGYSSLQYLKRLPLSQLKIDRSFVRDITVDSSDKAIVSTIIAMAHSLGLDVIAEGVETEEQRQLLLDNGCTNYQGFLFGKPIPIEQFESLLKQE